MQKLFLQTFVIVSTCLTCLLYNQLNFHLDELFEKNVIVSNFPIMVFMSDSNTDNIESVRILLFLIVIMQIKLLPRFFSKTSLVFALTVDYEELHESFVLMVAEVYLPWKHVVTQNSQVDIRSHKLGHFQRFDRRTVGQRDLRKESFHVREILSTSLQLPST